MMWNKQNIFEPSGCISREAFEAFLSDELTPDVRKVAEEHIASCEFCSDALEGFGSIGLPQASLAMEMVDSSFKKKYLAPKKNTRKLTWFSIAAAASVLLLSGLFFMLRDNYPKTQLAENTTSLKDKDTNTGMPGYKEEKPETAKTSIPEKAENRSVAHSETVSPKSSLDDKAASKRIVNSVEEEKKELREQAPPAPVVSSDEVQEDQKADEYSENLSKQKEPEPSSSVAGRSMRSYSKESVKKSDEINNDKLKDEIYVVVEQNASFQGGDINTFRTYVMEHLKLPDTLKDTDYSESGAIQFVIDQKGKLTGIQVLRSFGTIIDNEIIKVLRGSPRWTPARQGGKVVKQQFVLPISFHFQESH